MKKIVKSLMLLSMTVPQVHYAESQLATTDSALCANGDKGCIAKLLGPLFQIKQDITLEVPGDSPFHIFHIHTNHTIQEALEDLRNKRIADGATVTILLKENVQASETINIDHPDGDKIKIIGNCGGPKLSCKIQFKENRDGFTVAGGHQLGYLDQLELIGSVDSTSSKLISAISATNASQVTLGKDIQINNFRRGIYVSGNSNFNASNTVIKGLGSYTETSGPASYGIWAEQNSNVNAPSVTVSNTYMAVYASTRSMVDVSYGSAFNNANGFGAYTGSEVKVSYAKATNNLAWGVAATTGGMVICANTISNNNQFGFYADYLGKIICDRATASNDTYKTAGKNIIGVS